MTLAAKLSVDGKIEVVAYTDPTLEFIQEAVGGGYAEAHSLTSDITIWFNEEGKLKKMPFNQAATAIWIKYMRGTDYILGPVLFTGGTDDEGESLGLSEENLNLLKTYAAMAMMS